MKRIDIFCPFNFFKFVLLEFEVRPPNAHNPDPNELFGYKLYSLWAKSSIPLEAVITLDPRLVTGPRLTSNRISSCHRFQRFWGVTWYGNIHLSDVMSINTRSASTTHKENSWFGTLRYQTDSSGVSRYSFQKTKKKKMCKSKYACR